jgi:origin recognition complex subunit 5
MLQAQRKICTILISNIVWDKFHGGTGVREPYLVHFPAYSKEVMVSIISQDCPEGVDKGFFVQFATLMCNVFHGPCRDLNEIRHIVSILFPSYREPVERGEIDPSNSVQLFKAISPILRTQLRRLYLRTISSAEWLQHDATVRNKA